ncbi:MAG: hypothetical protein JW726_10050 [Anaerolineales bacterium]|nr:hypothetical protein [Anaerolineales bacterium]
MPSIDSDLRYFRAGLLALEDYLLSDELYWPIDVIPPAGEPAYPRLTLGNLLLTQARLLSRSLSFQQDADLTRLLSEFEVLNTCWRVAWEKKAYSSVRSRLNMWRNYLEEFRQDPEAHADRYAYEVRLRVILHLLLPYALAITPAEQEMLNGLDKILGAALVTGDFIWEPALESGFPRMDYWYLYGYLPESLPER